MLFLVTKMGGVELLHRVDSSMQPPETYPCPYWHLSTDK